LCKKHIEVSVKFSSSSSHISVKQRFSEHSKSEILLGILKTGNVLEIKVRVLEHEKSFQLRVNKGLQLGANKEFKTWISKVITDSSSHEGVIFVSKDYYYDSEEVILEGIDKEDCSKLEEYFDAYNELSSLHKKLGFGEGSILPARFSEGVCRKVFVLTESDTKAYDAEDGDNRVEIKSSIYSEGSVSINKDCEFEYLIWLYFDLEKKLVTFRRYDNAEINAYIKEKKSHLEERRITIRLKDVEEKYSLISKSLSGELWEFIDKGVAAEWKIKN